MGGNADAIVADAGNRLAAAGVVAGLASERLLSVGGEGLSGDVIECASAALTLITHPQVDAIVLSAQPGELLRQGLPLDRIDLLVIAGDLSADADLKSLLLLARPHLDGKALVVEGGERGRLVAEVLGETRVGSVRSSGDLAPMIAEALASLR